MIAVLTGDLTTETVASGVDTVAVGWSALGGSELASAMIKVPSVQVQRGFSAGFLLTEKDVSGARVLWYPDSSFVKVEGRLSALLARRDDVHDLAAPELLREAPSAARAALTRLVAAAPEGASPEIRRLDLASERRFDQGADGLAFLRAAALLTPGSAYKSKLIRAGDGTIETGYAITKSGRVLSRLYDKGVEARTDPPGRRVRLEAQNRFTKATAGCPEQLASADLRPLASRAWAAYAKHGQEAIVANIDGATEALMQRVGTRSLSVRKAERMIGTLTLLERYGRSVYDVRQGQRRLQDLRAEGIVVDELLPRERIVPVGELLRELLEPFDRTGGGRG